jgi:hypothetical protein
LRRTEAITAAVTLLVVLGVVAAAAELGSLPSTPGPSDHHLPAFFPFSWRNFKYPFLFLSLSLGLVSLFVLFPSQKALFFMAGASHRLNTQSEHSI